MEKIEFYKVVNKLILPLFPKNSKYNIEEGYI